MFGAGQAAYEGFLEFFSENNCLLQQWRTLQGFELVLNQSASFEILGGLGVTTWTDATVHLKKNNGGSLRGQRAAIASVISDLKSFFKSLKAFLKGKYVFAD